MNKITYLALALSFIGSTAFAQTPTPNPKDETFHYKDPQLDKNDEEGERLQANTLRTQKELKECKTLLENYEKILSSKSSGSTPMPEGNIYKKPKPPMSKSEIKTCIYGCANLLKEEFDYTFDPKTLKQAGNMKKEEDMEKAISGALGSCQIAEGKYVANMDSYPAAKKTRIEDGFKICPQSVKEFDFDVARIRVEKQSEVCKAKQKEYNDAAQKMSDQIDAANAYKQGYNDMVKKVENLNKKCK